MALPDYLKYTAGTAIAWGEASAVLMGVTVTNNMSLDALASGSGRCGVYADLGSDWDQEYLLWVLAETGTAPTAGTTVEVYLSSSHTTSSFPGKASGTDAAYSSTPSVATNKALLGIPASVLIATADATTELIQQSRIWRPRGRYVAPVYINLLGQALRDETTASDNTSGIILLPTQSKISDT